MGWLRKVKVKEAEVAMQHRTTLQRDAPRNTSVLLAGTLQLGCATPFLLSVRAP